MLEIVAESKINQALEHLPDEFNDGDMILVEDAGLFVSALDGFLEYIRLICFYHWQFRDNQTLNHLKTEDHVSSANLRAAHFKAVAVMWRNGEIIVGEGICPGHIALEPMEGNGFGFDPIFIPYDLDENLQPLDAGNYE